MWFGNGFAFSFLLLLQSDQAVCFPRYDVGIFQRSHTRDRNPHHPIRLPRFVRLLHLLLRLKLKRRFWCAPRRAGFWESEVCGTWQEVGRRYPDWEDAQYVAYFRMPKGVFHTVCGLYAPFLRKQDTCLRAAIAVEKRMAIVLYWLAHATSFMSVAGLFSIGKSTAVDLVHDGIRALRRHMVPSSICFPTGQELAHASLM